MPSNKNRDKLKQERTSKNEAIQTALSIVTVKEKNVISYKIVKLTFTMSGTCVSIEEVDRAKNESAAMMKFEQQAHTQGITDLHVLRNVTRELKEEK